MRFKYMIMAELIYIIFWWSDFWERDFQSLAMRSHLVHIKSLSPETRLRCSSRVLPPQSKVTSILTTLYKTIPTWLQSRKQPWKGFWYINMTQRTPTTNLNMSATTLTSRKSHPCILMLWFMSRKIWTQLLHSEDHVEKVSVAHVRWTVTVFILLLASVKLIETSSSQPL